MERKDRKDRSDRRVIFLFASVACVAVLAATNAQPIALAGVRGYQRVVSPVAARAGLRCRFTPTCSRYAEAVIARDGVVRGGLSAVRRIARCGPWTTFGTRDDP
jgi:putative membrane protein insertion efficiency factor